MEEKEKLYRTIFENTGTATVILEEDTTISLANTKFEELTGYTKEEIENHKKWTGFVVKEDLERMMSQHRLRRNDSRRALKSYEFRLINKHGEIRNILLNIDMIPGTMQNVASLLDITEHNRVDTALRESEEKYRLNFEHASDVIYTIDNDFMITSISQSVKTILGFEPDEIAGRTMEALTNIIAPEYLEEALSNTMKVLKGQSSLEATYDFLSKDGKRIVGETNSSPIIHDGKIVGIVGVARDVTDRKRAEEALEKSLGNLRKTLGMTIQAMALAVETKDPYTAGHQRRVADLARTIATEMGLTTDQIDGIRLAGTIHDLGKIAVPSEILSKPSTLSDIEFQLVKTHAQAGYDILKDLEFPWPIARMILEHHERMDGSGYPQDLSGAEILLESRILSVADVVEAIASHRPYRPAHGINDAFDEIMKQRGLLYDPDVVDACIRVFDHGYNFIAG